MHNRAPRPSAPRRPTLTILAGLAIVVVLGILLAIYF
jgi:hypothetical protein